MFLLNDYTEDELEKINKFTIQNVPIKYIFRVRGNK